MLLYACVEGKSDERTLGLASLGIWRRKDELANESTRREHAKGCASRVECCGTRCASTRRWPNKHGSSAGVTEHSDDGGEPRQKGCGASPGIKTDDLRADKIERRAYLCCVRGVGGVIVLGGWTTQYSYRQGYLGGLAGGSLV